MNTFRTQFLLLWRTRRTHALIFVALLCGGLQVWMSWTFAAAFRLNPEQMAGDYGTLYLITVNMFMHVLTAVAALWGVVVWRVEGPSQRGYHFSLPVELRRHDLLRVAGGAAWMLIISMFYAVIALALLLTTRAGDQAHVTWTFWLSFVTVTMIPYLLSSALAMASDRASEWLLGGYFVSVMLGVYAMSGRGNNFPWLQKFFFGPAGVARALSGGSSLLPGPGGPSLAAYDLNNTQLWALATTVWVCVSAGVMLLSSYAVHRRPLERLSQWTLSSRT